MGPVIAILFVLLCFAAAFVGIMIACYQIAMIASKPIIKKTIQMHREAIDELNETK